MNDNKATVIVVGMVVAGATIVWVTRLITEAFKVCQ